MSCNGRITLISNTNVFPRSDFCYSSDSLTQYIHNDDYLPVEPRNNTLYSIQLTHWFVTATLEFLFHCCCLTQFVPFSVSFRRVSSSSSSSSSSRNNSNSSYCKTRGSSHPTCGSRLTLNRYTQIQHITHSFVSSLLLPPSC